MSERPVASIKTLARYEPAAVYIGTGEYVAECVRADDGDYYLAADVDAAIEALRAEVAAIEADRKRRASRHVRDMIESDNESKISKWDLRFISMARLVASWSKDPSTKVGAVIVDDKHRVVSLGYNGPPRGVEDDPSIDRDTKLRRTIHAEKNAELFARTDLRGCTLYVTHHPCGPCAAFIIQAGIARVVVDGQDDLGEHWHDDIREARWMFDQSGVICEYIHGNQD